MKLCTAFWTSFFVSWNRAEEVIVKKNSASNTLVNWVTQSEHWKCNNRCHESDRAIKIIMALEELDTTSTCCVVWENSLHLTRKSGRILSIEKWTHLMRVKFKENSEAILNKGCSALGQVFAYNRMVYQNRLMSHRNNTEQLEKVRVPHTIIVGPCF